VWGGARVVAFDTRTLAPVREIPVGEHPNAMLLSQDGARLFVACANTNAVWVVDTATGAAREQISLSLYPDAPVGTTPNALALSPDGGTLFVANADNNTVAVVDVGDARASEVEGFLPVGWYPTGVGVDRAGRRLFVLNGKGLVPIANPRGPGPGVRHEDTQYIGPLLKGALSIVDVPGPEMLAALTKRVYELTPYTAARRLAPPEAPPDSPVPGRVGGASPIRYVFYVIRENRTYDQVLGDLPQGNGDPSLTLFGEDVTPNAHALAREFVLMDNFYVDAEVSYDGHAFSTGAYATDVVEKLWPTNYGGRGGIYLSEGGWRTRTPYGNFSAPPRGYLWDFAKRAGVSVRSYGEFAYWDAKGQPVKASVPGLEGLVHPSYPPYDLDVPDNERIDVWLAEFREFERTGALPRLSIIRLGGDHTSGTRPGAPTPRAMVAENDLALGRLVEAISHSRFWRESAIFVLEDDAQNGPDHVDAHRSIALVASPFVMRRRVDSTLYTTSGMLRTMELILGIEPMSQYDAAATPMYAAFGPTPDTTPFTHLPARVPLDERNDWSSPGAQASIDMNLDEADMAPERELNEILWQSVHGAGARMPPPRRAAFVRALGDE
jgi:YVTN family beta-propeller protein